jgi:hypothetical protein
MSFVNYVAKLLVPLPNRNVCFWHKADIAAALSDVRFWG